MDKNAIKKYAVWARKELIARVTQKAEQYEITEKKTTPADADSIGGRVLTAAEKKQRQALIVKINQDGFEQVMEEVAYTWFNRFTALRFMEVNNYLPSHTRVFTNENGEFKPQILADAIQLDLEGLNMDKVFALKDVNKTEELYKYLLITQCNALSGILPRMFPKIEDYTELLLPDYLLREGSVIEQMIALIPKEIGSFYHFIGDEGVRLIGCEAAGRGIDTLETAATIATGRVGIFHGMKSYFCQDQYGQIAPVYSISAGLDYPGVGPEHAHLHDIGRAEYVPVTDEEAVNAFEYLAKTEGIIPAIESAHAVAEAIRLAPAMDQDRIIVITISGRGDKDCAAIARYRGEDIHE